MPESPFELLEVIGHGSMGTVWRARLEQGGQIAAVKMLHRHLCQDPEFVARFEREVELTQRVHSPYVVQTLGFGKVDGVPYLIMEYAATRTLRDLIHTEGPLRCQIALGIVRSIAMGLAAIQAAGIVHRDVKPSNILVARDYATKLADFGVAKASDMTRLTATAAAVGTVAYMPPEGSPGPEGDFYSLGCVFYEMLTGGPPFEGQSYHQVFLRHLREAPDLSRTPAEVRPLLAWLLAKDPSQRPHSATELLQVLDGEHSVPSPWEPVPAPQRAETQPITRAGYPKRLGLLAMGGLACFVVVLALAAVFAIWTHSGDGTPPHLPVQTLTTANLVRWTKDNMILEVTALEVMGNGDLRIHERVTNGTGVDGWRWLFDSTGGTYVLDSSGRHILPIRSSLAPGEISAGTSASTTLKNGESQDIWVEFPPFRGMESTFSFYDNPLEFLNLSLGQPK